MAIEELHARFNGCSIWWQHGDANREAAATVVRGLPDPADFADMLSGR
jgi:hypothetical protein